MYFPFRQRRQATPEGSEAVQEGARSREKVREADGQEEQGWCCCSFRVNQSDLSFLSPPRPFFFLFHDFFYFLLSFFYTFKKRRKKTIITNNKTTNKQQ